MEVNQIYTEDDLNVYIEGCINDFESGISAKKEFSKNIIELILHFYLLAKENKVLFIVYKTDAWHSYNSRDLIGVCTSIDKAFDLCQQQAKKEGCVVTKDEWVKNQSQGYEGEGEFYVEKINNINQLL